ncbi:DUF4230 domain-containing protein [Vacuolonema iberomarrocanum]|uniref:DUF4230 domain-containing protein n=1 Tax=Vacuolonema iberomarrocanum TaxID=3454632 RepID=UPI0019FB13BD|nr:DUF4230 domain-containing protein [filamentous cyanobacterium LEGE 07170]
MSSRSSQSNSSQSNNVGQIVQTLSLLLTGGLVTAGLIVGAGVWRGSSAFLQGLRDLAPRLSEPQVEIETLVLQQIRGASELTTAVYTMQAVLPTRRDRLVAGYTLGSTTLLYIAQGEVRAGIDLSQISPAAVQVSETGTLTVQLPPPQILDRKIDVERSQVYDYDRGFLGLGPDVAPDLQTEAQRQTLQQIVTSACTEGILQEANERAEIAIQQLLSTAGNETVVVRTQAPAPDACLTQPSSLTEPDADPLLQPTAPTTPPLG